MWNLYISRYFKPHGNSLSKLLWRNKELLHRVLPAARRSDILSGKQWSKVGQEVLKEVRSGRRSLGEQKFPFWGDQE